jgi:hypothetical protein
MSKLWVRFKGKKSVRVSTEGCEYIADLLEACKKALSPGLDHIRIDELTVSITDCSLEPYDLRPGLLLVDLPSQPGYTPNNDENPLLLNIITHSSVTARSSSSSNLSNKPPHPARRRRWDKLNGILANNKKRNMSQDSTGYSNISWKEVKDVLATTLYIQEGKEIPDDSLDFLFKYISAVTVSFDSIVTGKEAKRFNLCCVLVQWRCSNFC